MTFDWFRSSIPTSDLPRTLNTQTCGELRLRLSYLVQKSSGLEYVDEEKLRPGNEIRRSFRSYLPMRELADGLNLSLHPPEKGKVDLKRWTRVFDERYVFLRDHWRELVSSQPEEFLKLIQEYGEDASQWPDIQKQLSLKILKISIAADDELTFGPSEHFPSFDLNIRIDSRNQITNASFDG